MAIASLGVLRRLGVSLRGSSVAAEGSLEVCSSALSFVRSWSKSFRPVVTLTPFPQSGSSIESSPQGCLLTRSPPASAPNLGQAAVDLLLQRSFAKPKGPVPRFQGGKLKVSTAFKERFKLMAEGSIKMYHKGFRHRRSRKGNTQRLRLKSAKSMHQTYANTMKRMGFK